MPGHSNNRSSSATTDEENMSHAEPEVSPWERYGNAFLDYMQSEKEPKKEVALYLSLNSTDHHMTEIPESLAALDQAEKEGLGKRYLLPISDPYYKDPHGKGKKPGAEIDFDTYQHSLGKEKADQITWWHSDKDLKEGEVRIGEGKPIMLGTENLDLTKKDDIDTLTNVRENWDKVLEASGMDEEYRAKTVASLLGSSKDPKKLASGDGATNELLQFAVAMYRSEKGEFDVKNIILSGHHWAGGEGEPAGKGIWGENPELNRSGGDGTYHGYDWEAENNSGTPGGDFFGLEDVGALRGAFPNAYSKVESVQFAACNTAYLGMEDEKGKELSTDEWLQGTFSGIERASYWEGIAPLARSGDYMNGEFLLDDMRASKDPGAWSSVVEKHNKTKNNLMRRSELNANGKLAPIDDANLKEESRSYVPGYGKSRTLHGKDRDYRNVNEGDREHIYTAGDKPIGWTPEKEEFQKAGENLPWWSPSSTATSQEGSTSNDKPSPPEEAPGLIERAANYIGSWF
jgi:hypothetical protein